MVEKTTQNRTYSRIKFKICNTIFLYFKKGQISIISTELQEAKLAYNTGQDIVTIKDQDSRSRPGLKEYVVIEIKLKRGYARMQQELYNTSP